jgi:mono/diheme cytochrome c family protein
VNRQRILIGLVLVTAVIVGLGGCDSRRPFGDFERMRVQQRVDPYSSSKVFANGAAMQAPPAHTVSIESVSDSGVLGSGQIAAGGQPATAVPIAVTQQLLETGRRAFGVYCAACHGPAGFGGSVVAANMGTARPPSLRSATARALPAGMIFRIATMGLGRMPSYASQLPTRERWAVVAYLQRLQVMPATDSVSIADSLRAAALVRDSAANRP